MNAKYTITRSLIAACSVLMLAACMDHAPPPQHPGPYDAPADAFHAVGTPTYPGARPGVETPMTNDVAHMGAARNAYEHSHEARAARAQARRQACRNNPDAKKVTIRDGTGNSEAYYCYKESDDSGDGE